VLVICTITKRDRRDRYGRRAAVVRCGKPRTTLGCADLAVVGRTDTATDILAVPEGRELEPATV
jgi:hypothetical protein